MKPLSRIWPHPFSFEKREVQPFVSLIIIYAVIAFSVSAVLGIMGSFIPIIPIRALLSVTVALTDLYSAVGIILSILKFTGIFE